MSAEYDVRKKQTLAFMNDKVIQNDARDEQVWAFITDVPKLSSPWQYVCFVCNVIIPGTIIKLTKDLFSNT